MNTPALDTFSLSVYVYTDLQYIKYFRGTAFFRSYRLRWFHAKFIYRRLRDISIFRTRWIPAKLNGLYSRPRRCFQSRGLARRRESGRKLDRDSVFDFSFLTRVSETGLRGGKRESKRR